jgi:Dockerin type I domain/Beta-propeller repeat
MDQGGDDAFVAKLCGSGSSLIYGTYLGGESYDYAYGIAVDGSGSAYVTGGTLSSDFPTLNAYQMYQGPGSVFVTKLTWTPEYSCGDVNTDEHVDLLDVVFLINYIFVGGPPPQSLALADVNCSGSINIGDAVLLINFIFRSGPAPCAGCQ